MLSLYLLIERHKYKRNGSAYQELVLDRARLVVPLILSVVLQLTVCEARCFFTAIASLPLHMLVVGAWEAHLASHAPKR